MLPYLLFFVHHEVKDELMVIDGGHVPYLPEP
jgi:hypothetical protein